MGNSYYPAMLNLKGKKVVVIGGGTVAKRKVLGLQMSGALITVVSPVLHNDLKVLFHSEDILWEQKEFSDDDLTKAFIIIAATNNSDVNLRVYEAKQEQQLINIVDRPDLSDFHVPSTVRRGRLLLTISTGGTSPSLSKKIRQELEKTYDEHYVDYLDFLHWSREIVLNEVFDQKARKKLLTSLADARWITQDNRNKVFRDMVEKVNDKVI